MHSNEVNATPTVADEVSAVIDDTQVIAKTLPVMRTPPAARQLKGHLDRALNVIRGYVIKKPMQAVLIAAAGSAMLTALLFACMRGEHA